MAVSNEFPYPEMKQILTQAQTYQKFYNKEKACEQILRVDMEKYRVWDDTNKLLAVIQKIPGGYLQFNMWQQFYVLNPSEKGKDIPKEKRFAGIHFDDFPELEGMVAHLKTFSTYTDLKDKAYDAFMQELSAYGWDTDEERLKTLIDFLPDILQRQIEFMIFDLKAELKRKEGQTQ